MDENRPMTKKERKEARRAQEAAIYREEGKQNMVRWGIIGLAAIIFLGFFGFLIFLAKQNNPATTSEPVEITESTGHVTYSGLQGSQSESTASAVLDGSAKVTLVEFGDFQCPACQQYHPIIKEVLEGYEAGQVKFIFKHFPLTSIHPNAMAGSIAAEAAGNQGKFFEYHDVLFDNQSMWGGLTAADADSKFVEYARQLSLNIERFNADRQDPATEATVRANMDEGINLGVNSTPTFFLDGERVVGVGSADGFRELIDKKIQ